MGGDTPDGSGGSMESARDEEQLALMDRETTGLELVPSVPAGRPTTYGPQRAREETRKKDGKGHGAVPSVDVNPFWSQTLKDEVMLRAMRPTSLPSAPTTSSTVEHPTAEDMGMDMKEVFKMIMSQNSMLKKELADLKKKVEDSNKERARDFKEADRPKPPTTTAPPSPPTGPPPATPEAEKRAGMAALGAIPEFPGGETGELRDLAHRHLGVRPEADRGPPPVPESWLGSLRPRRNGL